MKPPTLDPRLNERLKEAERRFEELDAELISPEVLKSPQRLRELGQERSRLEEIVGLGRKLARATQESLKELLKSGKTRQMTNYKL